MIYFPKHQFILYLLLQFTETLQCGNIFSNIVFYVHVDPLLKLYFDNSNTCYVLCILKPFISKSRLFYDNTINIFFPLDSM